MKTAARRRLPTAGLLILLVSAAAGMTPRAIKERMLQIEVRTFNRIIDKYEGGILFNLFGGKSKAKNGFLKTQRALNREDFDYFPEGLKGKEGKDSRTILKSINRDDILYRRSMVRFIRTYSRRKGLKTINEKTYRMLYGKYLLKHYGTIPKAVREYKKGIERIIEFNNSLSLGIFGGIIKGHMNSVTQYTYKQRRAFIIQCMRMARTTG